MKSTRSAIRQMAVSGAVVAGLLGVAHAQASAAPLATSPGESATRGVTFLTNCKGESVRSPRTFAMSCQNQSYTLRNLRWKNWGAKTATATGIAMYGGCEGECASTKGARYNVTFTVTQRTNGEASVHYRRASTVLTRTEKGKKVTVRHQWNLTGKGPVIRTAKK